MDAPAQPLLDKHHFTLRRLHSLTGIIPIGAFLINHLLANSTAFLGEEHFNHHIELIQSLPWLLVIEVGFIFIPLAFHGVYGLIIALQGRPNQGQYPYLDNWRYTLQRITAYITIAFVILHLLHFRFAHWFGEMHYSDAPGEGGFFAFTGAGFANMWLPIWAWMLIYLIGLTAAVFHFCNGIVTFCITWGIVIGDKSRQRLSALAGLIGIVLMLWGVLSLYALGTM
ncbi:MAG: succinate dehydrogenase [Planctomycetota bacterium]